MGWFRPPVRSPWTSSRASSTAMRCSFVQTHGLVRLRNVQTHSSSRNIRATQDQPSDMRSRSPVPRRSRVRLTPRPHRHAEDEDDWGEWTHCSLRTHEDRRRPRSPSIPPVRQVASTTVVLIHLPVRTSVPSLGSHRFVLRSGSQIEEIAILIDDVLCYTLPCIAEQSFRTHPSGRNPGKQSIGALCRTDTRSFRMKTE